MRERDTTPLPRRGDSNRCTAARAPAAPRRGRRAALCAALAGSVAASPASHAAIFCVDTIEGLSDTLATVQANGEADEVRLRVGTYRVEPPGLAVDLDDGTHGLALRGGYTDAGCTPAERTLDARATVLDGQQATRILTIATSRGFGQPKPDSTIEVSRLTFVNGRAPEVGALKISDPGPIYGGRILVEGNRFLRNRATTQVFDWSPGALLAATDGAGFDGGTWLVLRNNVFSQNEGPFTAATYLFSNNRIELTSNTFVLNSPTDAQLPLHYVLDYFTLTGVTSRNNIHYFNNPAAVPDTYDLNLADVTVFDDDIENPRGTPVAETGRLDVDPRFAAAVDDMFDLKPDSPLVDRGSAGPPGTLAEADIHGLARVAGNAVDVGAYELGAALDAVFDNGFE